MATGQNELTHEEMWDDSALIDSWNEALDEYKVSKCRASNLSKRFLGTTQAQHIGYTALTLRLQKYHSLHATGGRLEGLDLDPDHSEADTSSRFVGRPQTSFDCGRRVTA
jgi:hypothetical protein